MSKELDGTGLHYFGARYYNCSWGRLLTPDPHSLFPDNLELNEPQTLNPYSYCTNNPLKYVDLYGKWRYEANRQAFIDIMTAIGEARIPYDFEGGSYPDKLDCTSSLRLGLDIIEMQAPTKLLKNWFKIAGEASDYRPSTSIYEAAEANKYDLKKVQWKELLAGDLIVAKGHLESIINIDKDQKIIYTVTGSEKREMVIKRYPFNPYDKKSWWYDKFKDKFIYVRISEENGKSLNIASEASEVSE